VLTGPGEQRRQVHARHVIGADGLHSTVREQAGIAIEPSQAFDERLVVQFRAPLWDLVGEQRYGIYFVSALEGGSLLPVGKPDRWQLGMPWDSSAASAAGVTHERASRWIRAAAGDAALPIAIERVVPVGFGTGLAERFRAGNTFLIGDAAHRVTPRGGTGLNTAIRDGFDIGWKLGWVLRGWADEHFLDSYERERRPIAEFNTQRSSRPDGSLLGTAFGLMADIGGRVPHAWLARGDGLVSTLDLLGDGLTLFVGPDWAGTVESSLAGSPPVSVQRLDTLTARSLGLNATGSLMARPDGHPVALRNSQISAHEGELSISL
jgi:putative polyketide hydroxylase